MDTKPFPSYVVSKIIFAVLTLSSLLIFVSAFWQHIGSSAGVVMGESLTYGLVRGHVGGVAMGLGWASTALAMIGAIAMFVMILGIRVLADQYI